MMAAAARSSKLEALRSPVHVARVTLRVRDLSRVADFYERALGLVASAAPDHAVHLSAVDGTVLLALEGRPDLQPAPPSAAGLFHVAFLLPTRADLANWVTHAQSLGLVIEGASDHLVSEAIYLSDPEGNGIEIYVDRERADWPMDGAMVKMATHRLDGPSLMAEASAVPAPWRFPAGGRIGHVHLKVGDLAAAEAFYRDRLGMSVMARYPGAVFLGWGGYHHHIAVNVWSSAGAKARGAHAGLAAIEIAGEAGIAGDEAMADPSGNVIRRAA